MKTTVNYIGVIVYTKYEENVTLKGLDLNELDSILMNDKDAVHFEIRDIRTNTNVYTHFVSRETKRESERKGITYNAYTKNPYTYHEKIKWTNRAGIFNTKKLAEEKRVLYNTNQKNRLVDRCEFYINK